MPPIGLLPTRFGIQTGRYPTRKDATNFFSGRRGRRFDSAPPRPDGLGGSDDCRSLEEKRLRHLCRQWHLGPNEQFWPTKQGYDDNAGGFSKGGPYGGKKYFSPYGNPRLSDGPDGEHLPDRLASETCAFIEKNKGKPFFAMLSFYSVHTPLIGRPDLVAKYKKKAAEINGAEFGDEEMTWPKNGKTRKVRILQDAVYAAMVEAMDLAVAFWKA